MPEEAYKAVELKIIELNLKPGSKLAMICPEDWSPLTIVKFCAFANEEFKQRGWGFELICFPHGTELFSISPTGSFE